MKKISRAIIRLYKKLLKPNEMESRILRRLFRYAYAIDVGSYSYGCFDSARFGAGMTVGRYCSFAHTCRRMNGNHGMSFLTLHPYVYNTKLGLVNKETIERTHCKIEDDVWVGHNAIILPSVTYVGRGSVIAAGAVVSKNVPAYAVMAGVPARIIKMRFPDKVIDKIEASRWWEMEKEGLRQMLNNHPDIIFNPSSLQGEQLS